LISVSEQDLCFQNTFLDGFEDSFVLCQRLEECKAFNLPRSTKSTQRYLAWATALQSICISLHKVLINHRRKLQLPVPSLVIDESIRFPFFVARRAHPSGGSGLPQSQFCHHPSPNHFISHIPFPIPVHLPVVVSRSFFYRRKVFALYKDSLRTAL
jgi:hypothetical protein